MPKFKIEYNDPETKEPKVKYQDFEDTGTITAKDWAEDYAYALADKGWFKVTQQ